MFTCPSQLAWKQPSYDVGLGERASPEEALGCFHIALTLVRTEHEFEFPPDLPLGGPLSCSVYRSTLVASVAGRPGGVEPTSARSPGLEIFFGEYEIFCLRVRDIFFASTRFLGGVRDFFGEYEIYFGEYEIFLASTRFLFGEYENFSFFCEYEIFWTSTTF